MKKEEEVVTSKEVQTTETTSNEEVKANDSTNNEEPKPSVGKRILNYVVTTTNGMAYGLFATLIIGTILGTIGMLFSKGTGNAFCEFMAKIFGVSGTSGVSYILQILTGAGIGVGVAIALKLNPLQTIVLAATGEIASYFSLSTKFVTAGTYSDKIQIGDPLTVYLVCICVALAFKYVLRKKTPVDVLLIPLFGVFVGTVAALLVRYPAIYVTYGIQWLINSGTNAVPFVMGIVVAVLMGMALTAPISSAAIGAMIFNLGNEMTIAEALADPSKAGLVIASGAAIVGCCCQMVGFAVQSRRDNSIGMVASIFIGTSMLQFKNILKKPIVWLPTIIASAILGPVSTCWLKLACMGANAGMGTAGLVGQIGTFASMGNTWQTWVGIFGLEIVLPAVLVFGIDLLFRKFNLIKDGDLHV